MLQAASQGREHAEDPAAGLEPGRRPQTGAEWAALYEVELAEMKRVLAAQDVSLPASRFQDNDAELMRFAISGGILQVAVQACRAAQPLSCIAAGVLMAMAQLHAGLHPAWCPLHVM